MKQELLSHKKAYFLLVLGLFTFTVAFLAAWPNHLTQRVAVVTLGIFYFLWGVMTHLHTAHLNRQVLYEYVGISILATVLLLFLTF